MARLGSERRSSSRRRRSNSGPASFQACTQRRPAAICSAVHAAKLEGSDFMAERYQSGMERQSFKQALPPPLQLVRNVGEQSAFTLFNALQQALFFSAQVRYR
jgi:hypothetical protein